MGMEVKNTFYIKGWKLPIELPKPDYYNEQSRLDAIKDKNDVFVFKFNMRQSI